MKSVDLFAGAGGASLGLRDAGYEHLACIELCPFAVATLVAAGFPAINGDVRDLRLVRGLKPDLVWSSFPCQDWSTAGRRQGPDGDRNGWPWTIDAIDAMKPRWFIAENVTGLTQHKGACDPTCLGPEVCPAAYLDLVILKQLRDRYDVVSTRVLNASSFGVPQHRRRLIIVAGPSKIRFPEPTHGKPTKQVGLFGAQTKPWTTVREALGLAAWGTATNLSGNGNPGIPQSPDTPSCQPVAGGHALGGLYGWDRVQLDGGRNSDNNPGQERPHTLEEPAPAVNGRGNQMLRVIGGGSNPRESGRPDDRSYRDIADEPCTTIPANQIGNAGPWVVTRDPLGGSEPERLDHPSPTVSAAGEWRGSGPGGNPHKMQRASDALFLGTGRRRLTVEECAKLQDFPDEHPFQGTKTERYRQVGNAVPPKMAEVVGRAVMESDEKLKRSST